MLWMSILIINKLLYLIVLSLTFFISLNLYKHYEQ